MSFGKYLIDRWKVSAIFRCSQGSGSGGDFRWTPPIHIDAFELIGVTLQVSKIHWRTRLEKSAQCECIFSWH